MGDRIEVQRLTAADPRTVFNLLCDPQGHVAIDASASWTAPCGGGIRGGSITKV